MLRSPTLRRRPFFHNALCQTTFLSPVYTSTCQFPHLHCRQLLGLVVNVLNKVSETAEEPCSATHRSEYWHASHAYSLRKRTPFNFLAFDFRESNIFTYTSCHNVHHEALEWHFANSAHAFRLRSSAALNIVSHSCSTEIPQLQSSV